MSAQPALGPASPSRTWRAVVVPDTAPCGDGVPPVAVPTDGGAVPGLAPASVASAWRRRLGAVAVLVLLAFGLTVAIGRVTAGAQLADPVAGTATIAPGETLWDVAADTAPSGSDTRDQLGRIVELNALDGGDVAAWTVVLLPAR